MSLKRSLRERFFHAVVFEIIAVTLCATLGTLLLGFPLVQVGTLTLVISLIAMGWSMAFNALFDRAQLRMGFQRNVGARVVHAVLLEIGLLVTVVPLAAWWLDITLWRAFVLDIGLVLFFLPYTFFFNLSYDRLRERFMARRSQKIAAAVVVDKTCCSSR